MKKLTSVQKVVIIIGSISIITSLISFLTGNTLEDSWWGAFLGIVLIGSALIQTDKQGITKDPMKSRNFNTI
jgi:hypothetical protein